MVGAYAAAGAIIGAILGYFISGAKASPKYTHVGGGRWEVEGGKGCLKGCLSQIVGFLFGAGIGAAVGAVIGLGLLVGE